MLTKRQKQTLDFIKHFMSTHEGIAPTAAEIAAGLAINSRGVVHRYLTALQDAGYIKLIAKRHRNIQLIHDSSNSIPLLGSIAAGQPIEAVTDNEVIHISDFLVGHDRYALKVKGDSMIEEGIFDGDIVICQRSQAASNGQIVVALIDHEVATLKRLLANLDGTITLLPANATHSAQNYPRERVTIQGIFVGLLRFAN